ncbi:MAG: alanyl-tRNA editing protein, partial [Acidobacteria bacterium]
MTERLYYRDSFLREFEAQVVSAEAVAGKWHVQLDRTAFYPTSGGQPNDLGRLGSPAVLDVFEGDGHTVVHVTGAPVAEGPVHGAIDWERRFDHMQQHTGQHLLSAAFVELFQWPTVSSHLGRQISTIDLAAPGIDVQQLEQAGRRTNQI